MRRRSSRRTRPSPGFGYNDRTSASGCKHTVGPGVKSMPTQLTMAEQVIPARSQEADGSFLELVGNARLVLLGEATHGTHEFYAHRAHLTRLLVQERGFSALAVEADWPDAYRVNRFVRGQGADQGGIDALLDFRRFPQWMWRNRDVVALV